MAGLLDLLWPALIKQESGGNPLAVSPRGAFGLAQLMPGTARDPGFGVKPFDPNVPGDNERMGRDYLAAMLARYNNDPKRALVAYNWGPGNADKWSGDEAALPSETRGYVKNILGSQPMMLGPDTSMPSTATQPQPVYPQPPTKEPVMADATADPISQLIAQMIAERRAPQSRGLLGSLFPKALPNGLFGRNLSDAMVNIGAGLSSGRGWGGAGMGMLRAAESKRARQDDEWGRNKDMLELMLMKRRIDQGSLPEVPSGFQPGPGGTLAPIPGGPADPNYLRDKPDRQHIPAGYDWDPKDPTKLVPIPGGPASKLPENVAGAAAMMDTAEKEMTETKAKEVLTNMGHLSGDIAGFWGMGDVGRAQRSIRLAVEASLRLLTGAAAPEEEVARYTDMFTPQGLESTATRTQKLRALQTFMDKARAKMLQGRVAQPDETDNDPLGIR